MSTYNIQLHDNKGITGTVGVPIDPAATDPNLQAFYDAVDAVALGTMGEGYVSERLVKQVGSEANSPNPTARKVMYWHCKFSDNVNGQKRSFSIPTADPSLVPGVTVLDLGSGVGATLKSTFETIGQTLLGNAVTLNSVELKGRPA